MPAQEKVYPKDVLVVIEMLKEFGITEYEPGVVSQIMEFGQRYVLSVLDDAKACSEHAGKRCIDHDDLKLAVMMQLESKFTTPPPRDLMLEISRTTNNSPLPYMKPFADLSFPNSSHRILSCNYKPLKKKLPDISGILNLNGAFYRKHVKTENGCSKVYFTRGGGTFIKQPASNFSSNAKAYQVGQKRPLEQNTQQMPQRDRVYPSQQDPPLPFPYPQYMKPLVVYIKRERVSPIPEIENDVPPPDSPEEVEG